MKKEKNPKWRSKDASCSRNLYQTKYDYILHVFMIRKHEEEE